MIRTPRACSRRRDFRFLAVFEEEEKAAHQAGDHAHEQEDNYGFKNHRETITWLLVRWVKWELLCDRPTKVNSVDRCNSSTKTQFERRFRPGWKMTLVSPRLLLPVVLSLGSWQRSSGPKRSAGSKPPIWIGSVPWPAAPGPTVADFQRIRLVGSYEAGHDFLLDNQIHRDGQIGYGVISLFRPEDGRGWLVNRGFLPGDRARRSRPEVRTPEGTVSLVGLVWPELGLLPVFGEDRWSEGWPKVIQRLEVARMAAAAAANVMANEVRLEAGQPGCLHRQPVALNMPAIEALRVTRFSGSDLAAALCDRLFV